MFMPARRLVRTARNATGCAEPPQETERTPPVRRSWHDTGMANSNRRRRPADRRPGVPAGPGTAGRGGPPAGRARAGAPAPRKAASSAPPRTRRRPPAWLSWAVPAVIVVLAIAGYFVFVPQTVADQQRLDALVVQRSGIA